LQGGQRKRTGPSKAGNGFCRSPLLGPTRRQPSQSRPDRKSRSPKVRGFFFGAPGKLHGSLQGGQRKRTGPSKAGNGFCRSPLLGPTRRQPSQSRPDRKSRTPKVRGFFFGTAKAARFFAKGPKKGARLILR